MPLHAQRKARLCFYFAPMSASSTVMKPCKLLPCRLVSAVVQHFGKLLFGLLKVVNL